MGTQGLLADFDADFHGRNIGDADFGDFIKGGDGSSAGLDWPRTRSGGASPSGCVVFTVGGRRPSRTATIETSASINFCYLINIIFVPFQFKLI